MRIHIKDIKEGQHFWEKHLEFVALEDAFRQDEGWKVMGARVADPYGPYTYFFVKDNFEHYGPDLYTEQAYFLNGEENNQETS